MGGIGAVSIFLDSPCNSRKRFGAALPFAAFDNEALPPVQSGEPVR